MKTTITIYNYLLALLLVLCSICASAKAQTKALPTPQKKVQIFGDAYFPPYDFINEEGQPDGFFVDLTKAVMNELSLPYSLQLINWSEAMKKVQDKKGDLLIGISYSEGRSKMFKFCGSLIYLSQSAVYRKGQSPVMSLKDLSGKKIVVENQGIAQHLLSIEGFTKNVSTVDKVSEGFDLLSKGHYDVLVCDYETSSYVLFKKTYSNLEMTDLQLASQLYSFAGNDEVMLAKIDWAIQRLKAKGIYNELYNKWFNKYPFKWAKQVVISIVILILVALLLWFFNILLRRKVNKAKLQLDEKNRQLLLALHAGGIFVWGYDVKKNLLFNIECDYFPPEGIAPDKDIVYYHPDDREFLLHTIKEVAKGNIPKEPICVRMNREGSNEWKYIEKEFSCIRDKAGEVITIIGTHKDVTERHRMQSLLEESVQKMAFAIKNANLVLWEYDVNTGLLKSYNEPINDYNDSTLLKSNDFLKYGHPDDLTLINDAFRSMRERSDKPFSINLRLRYKPDGEWRYCIIAGTSFIKNSKTGDVIKYVGLRRDVTEMTLVNKKLEEEKIKAQEADKLKSTFLANMSHEIRTPLNAIVGFSNLLDSTSDPEERAGFVKLINTNSGLLLQLINDILDLSKIESGILDIHNDVFNFSDAFEELHQSFLSRIENPEIKFICDNKYKTFNVCIDYNRTMQILTNFITNALKYTKEGYIKMSYFKENDGLKIIVEDTGIGIAKEKSDRIFKRFEKLDNFAQGTGLGLSICKAIIRACKGDIGFDSEEGKGSTFWAWIPCEIMEIVEK